MKIFGICLIIAGLAWGIIAFNMETTVTTEGQTFGEGLYSIRVPSQTVHNLDLADRRRNHLIGAGIAIISGILLFGFGTLQPKSTTVKINKAIPKSSNLKCPYCNTEVKNRSAKVCHYCDKAYNWA